MVVKMDAEMTEREGRGFRGAAGSRSAQTDAAERRGLGEREQGQCVCVCVCWGRETEVGGVRGEVNYKHHTTFDAASTHPCND